MQTTKSHANSSGFNFRSKRMLKMILTDESFKPAPPVFRLENLWRAFAWGNHQSATGIQADLDRAPKIAVPTRTMVLPHAMAASKSAVIPIESVSIVKKLTSGLIFLEIGSFEAFI